MHPDFVSHQLVYLVYGGRQEYLLEAKYSILTAIREGGGSLPRILVYTDRPLEFQGWPVDTVELDQSILSAWMGPNDYIHRRKACAIRDALNFAEVSVFVDTDTFFLGPPERLFRLMEEKLWLVDTVEARWGDWAHLPIYKLLSKRLEDIYGTGDDMPLINSGVLGLRHDKIALMEKAISLIDELVPSAPEIHIIEQFAIGLAAVSLGRPAEAMGTVRHYFSEKNYWRAMIGKFFEINGESFSLELPVATICVPKAKPKPGLRDRAFFKFRSAGLSAGERKLARLAYYAVHLPHDEYSEACRMEYCNAFAKASPLSVDALTSGSIPPGWGGLFSSKKLAELQQLLLERISSKCSV